MNAIHRRLPQRLRRTAMSPLAQACQIGHSAAPVTAPRRPGYIAVHCPGVPPFSRTAAKPGWWRRRSAL